MDSRAARGPPARDSHNCRGRRGRGTREASGGVRAGRKRRHEGRRHPPVRAFRR